MRVFARTPCRRGGGPIDWVMAARGCRFLHAVELLVQESGSFSGALGCLARRRVELPGAVGMFRLGSVNRILGYRLGSSQTTAISRRVC